MSLHTASVAAQLIVKVLLTICLSLFCLAG
jgi:hypothetical protein